LVGALHDFGQSVPSFEEAAKASREVLLECSEDSNEITEERAFPVRVYMNKKFGVSSVAQSSAANFSLSFFASPADQQLRKLFTRKSLMCQ